MGVSFMLGRGYPHCILHTKQNMIWAHLYRMLVAVLDDDRLVSTLSTSLPVLLTMCNLTRSLGTTPKNTTISLEDGESIMAKKSHLK